MKKILSIFSFLATAFILTIGCKKEAERVADFTMVETNNQALLKINYNSAYNANPSVQLKVNDTRVSGLITARTPFPGGGFNTGGDNRPDYLPVAPGGVKLGVAVPKKDTPLDSIALFTTTLNLEANKYYTVHITDTGANTKVVLLTDDVSMPDTGSSRYKFVHLMPNVTALDLYHNTDLVASNVPYLSSVVFTRPTWGASQTWNLREAGTGAAGPILATYTSANTVLVRRGYTVFAVGYKGATDATRRPYVSFLLNH